MKGSSPLLWTDKAWQQLLGRDPAEAFCVKDGKGPSVGDLLMLEGLMLYSRITVLFGWSEEVGKLVVCEVLGG